MKTYKLSDMTNGWFVGNFHPTVIQTQEVEIAIKKYKEGDCEKRHYHKISTELTIVIEGVIKMNNTCFSKGDIIVINPNEGTDFFSVTDCNTVVVKIPSALNDKYVVNEQEDIVR